jgi:two-component system phosphate regulon sensor histidine kinase PhoR
MVAAKPPEDAMTQTSPIGLLETVPLPVLLIGPDGRIEGLNARARDVLGADVLERLYLNAFRQPLFVDAIEAALTSGQGRVVRMVRQVGATEQVFRVTCSPVKEGVICAFEDVSEAEQIGQMRRDFVANVSHELRSPLTALLGFIETLQGAAKDDPPARDRFLGVMAREAGRMNRLVGDLLSLSRVEAQERVAPTQAVDMALLLRRVAKDIGPIAEAARVRLELMAEPGGTALGAFALADTDQMVQVLTNLIENAVKYGGSDKRVVLALQSVAHDAQLRGPAVVISVTDQGEGIAAIHLPRLTERFYRVDAHRSREKGGTGLGLAIVKHILNRHRGRLRITSEIGVGSCFTVLLPAAEVTAG